MPANNDHPAAERQAAARQKYAALQRAVEEAGFFAPHVRAEKDWDDLVCTSKHRKGFGYTGIILFVTEVGGSWFLLTPHPYHYRIRNPSRVAQVVIAYLGKDRRRKQDASMDVDLDKDLLQISYDEFEQVRREA